jgi:hypothetical protein
MQYNTHTYKMSQDLLISTMTCCILFTSFHNTVSSLILYQGKYD